MGEPEADNKAEQAASEIANKQETEQLLTLRRKEVLAKILAPSNMLGLLSLYFLLVGTIVAFGVLAFYTGHKITQEIVFFISAALFLIPPVGALWYMHPFFIKKDAIRKLVNRITQSPLSWTLARLGNNRSFRLFTLAMYALVIAFAIYSSPKHPRFSLVVVVIYMAFSFGGLITWASEVLERKIYVTLGKFLEFSEETFRIARNAFNMAKGSHDFIQGTEESHSEAHKTTVTAIRAINDALQLVATVQVQVDAPPKEIDSGKAAEGDPEP
mgnify:CR=1 FL=1